MSLTSLVVRHRGTRQQPERPGIWSGEAGELSAVERAGGIDKSDLWAGDSDSLRRYHVKVSGDAKESAYIGRFFPVSLTRRSRHYEDQHGQPKIYLPEVLVPTLSPHGPALF